MIVNPGDKVVINYVETPELENFIGKVGTVKTVIYAYHPAWAVVTLNAETEVRLYVRCLEVIPPETSLFQLNEKVQITKIPTVKNYKYRLSKHLLNCVGIIRGYDTRNEHYLVVCGEDKGWFPVTSLRPTNYKGNSFYYPLQEIKYRGEKKIIQEVKISKDRYGQVLKIDGEWIPSSNII